MSGTAMFFLLVGVAYVVSLPFKFVDWIEGKVR